jgi:hypothetical protein
VFGRAEDINGKTQSGKPIPVSRFGLVDLRIHKRIILHFIIFSVAANIHNKKTKGPTVMELLTATGKLEECFFNN